MMQDEKDLEAKANSTACSASFLYVVLCLSLSFFSPPHPVIELLNLSSSLESE